MRDVFELMKQQGHEQVTFFRHEGTGLEAIVAIHNTTMGPALGGCRMQPYESTDDALEDVLRLSRGMTFKCGVVDVDFGGGKVVIKGNPNEDKSPEMFRALGRFVGGMNGRFFTGTDMGTNPEDFVHSARESSSFVGLPTAHGGSGDTSIPTAYGVLQGLRATAKHMWGSESLDGKSFAIQGLGKVGYRLIELLINENAHIMISDINVAYIERAKALIPGHLFIKVVAPEIIHSQEVDFYVPCALGGVINDTSIGQLRCKAIVGSANNQLKEERHGEMLYAKGIHYAPDYLVNAGGLIQVADELKGYNPERVLEQTRSIYNTLLQIYKLSEQKQMCTSEAANHLVLERIKKSADLKTILIGSLR